MRVAITGRHGQIARAVGERSAAAQAEIVTLARPDVDLRHPAGVLAALRNAKADIVINAAAYTSVDLAESELELARAINVTGAAAVAEAARTLNLPMIYLSTDYVFDGGLDRPYREDDVPHPINQYGRSKLEGEKATAAANSDHAILRTSWVYSPFGKNFLRNMLTAATSRKEVAVVADQIGVPTSAFDIADGLLKVAHNLLAYPDSQKMRGIFHMTATGEATWADFAQTIFATSAAAGGPSASVRRIPSSGYPTPAKRPQNSRLDTAKLARIHHVSLPSWQSGLRSCIDRLMCAEFDQKS